MRICFRPLALGFTDEFGINRPSCNNIDNWIAYDTPVLPVSLRDSLAVTKGIHFL